MILSNKQQVIAFTFILGVSGIIASAVGMSLLRSNSGELVEACKQIQIGMTEDQVHSIMGLPVKAKTIEFNGRNIRILMYPASALAATLPEVVIDPESHRVEEVVCDEGYRLVRTQEK